MSNGTDIAAEIKAGLMEAAEATGDGPLWAVIKRAGGTQVNPWDPPGGTPIFFVVTCLDDESRMRAIDGTLIQQVVRVITIEAQPGVVPKESDQVVVGFNNAGDVPNQEWQEIISVLHVAPGGVPLMYELEVKA